MYIGLRVMFPSFLPDFNKFEFPQHIIANTEILSFMKTLPVEVDRHDEANTRFWKFCESAPANVCELSNRCQ
jgi:hypothetical protein